MKLYAFFFLFDTFKHFIKVHFSLICILILLIQLISCNPFFYCCWYIIKVSIYVVRMVAFFSTNSTLTIYHCVALFFCFRWSNITSLMTGFIANYAIGDKLTRFSIFLFYYMIVNLYLKVFIGLYLMRISNQLIL